MYTYSHLFEVYFKFEMMFVKHDIDHHPPNEPQPLYITNSNRKTNRKTTHIYTQQNNLSIIDVRLFNGDLANALTG